jgi:hypothetical protein
MTLTSPLANAPKNQRASDCATRGSLVQTEFSV